MSGGGGAPAGNTQAWHDVPTKAGTNPFGAYVYKCFTPVASPSNSLTTLVQEPADAKVKPGHMVNCFTGIRLRRNCNHTRMVSMIIGPPEKPAKLVLKEVCTHAATTIPNALSFSVIISVIVNSNLSEE